MEILGTLLTTGVARGRGEMSHRRHPGGPPGR